MFYTFRIGPYARQIYLDGNRTFVQIAAEDPKYPPAVKDYASKNFSHSQIDNALTLGHISQQEYDETIALKELITPRTSKVTDTTTEPTV